MELGSMRLGIRRNDAAEHGSGQRGFHGLNEPRASRPHRRGRSRGTGSPRPPRLFPEEIDLLQPSNRLATCDKLSVIPSKSRQFVTPMTPQTQADRILELIRQRGLLRGADLDRLGIHRMHLKRLVDRGVVVRRARGVYEAAEPRISEHDSIVEVTTRVPKATICLLTALRIHQLTTQNPFDVWIMIDRKARPPSIDSPPVRVVRASGSALTEGVETMTLDGAAVHVTSVAKTVADCFKYRSVIGVDVAIEALRDAWRGRRACMDEIVAMAKVDRVATVMRPYLESVV